MYVHMNVSEYAGILLLYRWSRGMRILARPTIAHTSSAYVSMHKEKNGARRIIRKDCETRRCSICMYQYKWVYYFFLFFSSNNLFSQRRMEHVKTNGNWHLWIIFVFININAPLLPQPRTHRAEGRGLGYWFENILYVIYLYYIWFWFCSTNPVFNTITAPAFGMGCVFQYLQFRNKKEMGVHIGSNEHTNDMPLWAIA